MLAKLYLWFLRCVSDRLDGHLFLKGIPHEDTFYVHFFTFCGINGKIFWGSSEGVWITILTFYHKNVPLISVKIVLELKKSAHPIF